MVTIIGAGLSGCEAALQLAEQGIQVVLYDQKPSRVLKPYSLETFAELVCNNSLGSTDENTALGLLIAELKQLGSKLLLFADDSKVNDGDYLAINKKTFSEKVSEALTQNPNISVLNRTITTLPEKGTTIVASGPITNGVLLKNISSVCGLPNYYFSDSSCVVVDINSLDLTNPYIEKRTNDLYAVHIPQISFNQFAAKLAYFYSTRKENNAAVFSECQTIEKLASQGTDKLRRTRFSHPGTTSSRCLLLRREGALENGFIMVGCMTTLCYAEQRLVFSMLPGFEKVRIIKYGRMHQNTFFRSPGFLDPFYRIKEKDIYIIGQLSGIDGYAPAIASGFVAAQRIIHGDVLPVFPIETMIGGLANYVSNIDVVDFQPMCASFALIPTQADISKTEGSYLAISKYLRYLKQHNERNSI